MATTYYKTDLTKEQIEQALHAVNGVASSQNNGKVLYIDENGEIKAKSAAEWTTHAVLQPGSASANGDFLPPSGVDGFSEFHVNVQGYPEPTGTIQITSNGTVNVKDYASAEVNVPSGITAADEGKVVKNGALVAQTARATDITGNGTYDTTENNSVTVSVSGGSNNRQYLLDPFVLDGARIAGVSDAGAIQSAQSYQILSHSFNGESVACLALKQTLQVHYAFLNKIPHGQYEKLCILLESTKQSAASTVNVHIQLRDMPGLQNNDTRGNPVTEENPACRLLNNSKTKEWLEEQNRVISLELTDNVNLPAQLFEFDVSGISSDFYFDFYNQGADTYIREIYLESTTLSGGN